MVGIELRGRMRGSAVVVAGVPGCGWKRSTVLFFMYEVKDSEVRVAELVSSR